MSKHKKRMSRRFASKERIAQARYAKKHGLISKNAKLDHNRLSRRVEKKLEALEYLKAVPSYRLNPATNRTIVDSPAARVAVKVDAKLAAKAKQQGFEVFNNRLVTPKSEKKRVVKAVTEGRIGGTSILPQVGAVERIQLDKFGIRNYADLMEILRNGGLQNAAKRDDEGYVFTLNGFGQRADYAFFDDEMLYEYLQRYKFMENSADNQEKLFEGFYLFKLPATADFQIDDSAAHAAYRKAHPSKIEKRKSKRRQMARENAQRFKASPEELKKRDALRKRKKRASPDKKIRPGKRKYDE